MSKIPYGDHTPTPEDIELTKQFLDRFEESVFPKYTPVKIENQKLYDEACEIYMPKSIMRGLYKPQTFYQSKYFTFFLKTDKGDLTPLLKLFTNEKDFQNFIKKGRYLIYRCVVGNEPIGGKNRRFAVYYHYDFGKIGWLKNKLQFIINNFDIPKELVCWYYNLKKIPMPKLDIKIRR